MADTNTKPSNATLAAQIREAGRKRREAQRFADNCTIARIMRRNGSSVRQAAALAVATGKASK